MTGPAGRGLALRKGWGEQGEGLLLGEEGDMRSWSREGPLGSSRTSSVVRGMTLPAPAPTPPQPGLWRPLALRLSFFTFKMGMASYHSQECCEEEM